MSKKIDEVKKILGDQEESEKKYKNVKVPETIADVAVLYSKIKEACPNSMMYSSGLGSHLKQPFTLVSTHPVSKQGAVDASGLDRENKALAAKLVGMEEDEILDKDEMIIPMTAMMIHSICESYGFDPLRFTKLMGKLLKGASNLERDYKAAEGK